MAYLPGQIVILSAVFTDINGNPADPTTVNLYTRDPLNVLMEYTGSQITKDSVGHYHMNLQVEAPGHWNYRWEGTGAIVSAQESGFIVSPSAVL